MYADDIILISTSIGNAQAMLKIVTEFSKTHQIKFNNFQIYEIILKVCKILRKIKIDYGWIFNPLQKWDLISLKVRIFTSYLLELTKILIILFIFPIFQVKILNFKEIKFQFCRGYFPSYVL